MFKGIKITDANRTMLASRFDIEDAEDELPAGFWLVTNFGNDETFDVIAQGLFDQTFVIIEDIKNGFKHLELLSTHSG